VELLHTLAAKYERLARHLETSTVFSGFSNIIQNDLIAAIGDVVRYDVKEISAAPFVAAEVDESTDVTNKAQISVIVWPKAILVHRLLLLCKSPLFGTILDN